MRKITVHKRDHEGQPVWAYEGDVLQRTPTLIKLEAYFNRNDMQLDYHTFRRGDLMIEWFFTNRWYNIFEMYDVESNVLKGWYCNITRPAQFEENALYADDLALDVMIYPSGDYTLLDEDDFEALEIDAETRQRAENGLQELLDLVSKRSDMFSKIEA